MYTPAIVYAIVAVMLTSTAVVAQPRNDAQNTKNVSGRKRNDRWATINKEDPRPRG